MLRYKLFRVKEGKLATLKAWSDELRLHAAEVSDTLVFENVSEEAVCHFSVGAETYAVAMQSLVGPHRKADMSVDLNKKHMAVMAECLLPYDGETLYNFRRS